VHCSGIGKEISYHACGGAECDLQLSFLDFVHQKEIPYIKMAFSLAA